MGLPAKAQISSLDAQPRLGSYAARANLFLAAVLKVSREPLCKVSVSDHRTTECARPVHRRPSRNRRLLPVEPVRNHPLPGVCRQL